jgi:hypothetical protein
MTATTRLISFAVLAVLAPVAWAQQAYPSPDAAAEALVRALGSSQRAEKPDEVRLAALLGADWRDYVPVGSVGSDDVDAFVARYREHHEFKTDAGGREMLSVGKDAWTLPVPLEKRKGGGWAFDMKAGAQEIRIRRIGRNELAAAQAARAYEDAQDDYATVDRDGDGVLEYAQKFLSSDGKHDGLYWADQPGEEESPLGPLFGDDTPSGDWHGYHYRILAAQGPSAPGGAYDYMLGDNMSRGFALVAWPTKYGDSGVMSFMISHEGELFEKDLGPESERVAKAMTTFDPDSSWKEVPDTATATTTAP